jgi:hypothetical protein
MINIIPVDTLNHQQVTQFLDLPFMIYRKTPQWVPPLSSDAGRMLDHKRNPYYRHSEAVFFLATQNDGRPIARLAVLDNRRYNEYNHEKTGFFYLFESENDAEAACALFDEAVRWCRSRGLNKIIGPKGFTTMDGLGLLVKGFDQRPAFGLPYNLPYYADLVEKAGFQPENELVSGYLSSQMELPDRILRAAELIKKRRGLHVSDYKSRNDLKTLIPRLQTLYNNSLDGTTGNVPLTDEEVKALADQILWFANPRLIKIIWKGDEPVGFLLAYPDISAALQRTRGRLWPFGWIDMLMELKRTKWININGAGIIEQYRGLGGTALLFAEMHKSVKDSGYQHADLVQIGVENDRMQRELRELGIQFYKTHRVYQQDLG